MMTTSILEDAKYAVRALARQPYFTAATVLILALGIGANTAIFSVVRTVLLDRAPYPAEDPDEVVVLTESSAAWDAMSVAYPDFKDWQRLNRSFETMAAFRESTANLTGLDEPLRLSLTQVSADYFRLLGLRPAIGRVFDASEDVAGGPPLLVLNHELWTARFGADPEVIGRQVDLDDRPFTVIGVLPEGFENVSRQRAFAALEPWAARSTSSADRSNHQGIYVLARLRDGVRVEEARTEMQTISGQLEREYPKSNTGVGATVAPLADRIVEDFEVMLWVLLGAVTLVLLIACANIANLLLARAVKRKRLTAIRAALGASRARLARHGLAEGLVLAIVGGAVGALLALAGLSVLKGLLPADLPGLDRVRLDRGVLVYTFALSIVTGLLFGSLPAWLAALSRPGDALKAGSRDTGDGVVGRGLLVAEVALATLLLIGAGLLTRSLLELSDVDPGFRPEHLLALDVGVPYSRYSGEKRIAFLRRLDEAMRSVPGVENATVGLVLPMKGSSWSSVFVVGDRPPPERGEIPTSLFTPVSTDYFETLEIPLLEGRLFTPADRESAQEVVVINETLAKRLWPDRDPIGQRLKQGWPESGGSRHPWREVVGVVGDVKQFGLGVDSRMQTYIPIGQAGSEIWDVQVALRSSIDPLALVEPIKSAIAELDATLPIYDVEPMTGAISESIAPRRFAMILVGLFAILALVLSAVGLYSVVAYSVARRTREIGLRVAVGADSAAVFRMVVRQGMSWSLLGSAIGLAAAGATGRLLAGSLYGVTPHDPLTFASVPALLVGVAFVATALPALVASRVDPIRALRDD